jgi:16S rRNA processing protein RimM
MYWWRGLEGVNDRNAAEKLNGVELYVDRALLPDTDDDDDFYHADLIGLKARLVDGSEIGEVMAVPNFGAGDLLEIRDPARATPISIRSRRPWCRKCGSPTATC